MFSISKVLHTSFGVKLDQFYHILVSIIILSIFILAYSALQHPINALQYQQMVALSQQATYPKTQQMAEKLLHEKQIRRIAYLKVLNAYQFESDRIKQYPAMAQHDE